MMIMNDPQGFWCIQHENGNYLADDPAFAGSFWTKNVNVELKYLTQTDAQYICDGLIQRSTVLQGISCGNVISPKLTVVEISAISC